MKIKFKEGIFILGFALLPSVIFGEESLALPEGVESKVKEILKIKKEAMAYPQMRSDDGILGKRIEKILSKIGELITDPELIVKIRSREGNGIEAKIALWALDKKERPEEYERFAKYYVNSPVGRDEAVEYFTRSPKGVDISSDPDPFTPPFNPSKYQLPRPGLWTPNAVDPDDQKEKFRLIIEYYYYMPPTGRGFDRDVYRSHLGLALIAIGNYEKSIVILANDAELQKSIKIRNLTEGPSADKGGASLFFLAKIPRLESFAALSRIGIDGLNGERMELVFKNIWVDSSSGKIRPTARKSYDAWQDLAQKDWDSPSEKAFATWLRKQSLSK